jgi:hypothetical protein
VGSTPCSSEITSLERGWGGVGGGGERRGRVRGRGEGGDGDTGGGGESNVGHLALVPAHTRAGGPVSPHFNSPELGADLVTALAALEVDNLAPEEEGAREGGEGEREGGGQRAAACMSARSLQRPIAPAACAVCARPCTRALLPACGRAGRAGRARGETANVDPNPTERGGEEKTSPSPTASRAPPKGGRAFQSGAGE